jgi:hypothetical protein
MSLIHALGLGAPSNIRLRLMAFMLMEVKQPAMQVLLAGSNDVSSHIEPASIYPESQNEVAYRSYLSLCLTPKVGQLEVQV